MVYSNSSASLPPSSSDSPVGSKLTPLYKYRAVAAKKGVLGYLDRRLEGWSPGWTRLTSPRFLSKSWPELRRGWWRQAEPGVVGEEGAGA